ncbi:MAG: hypothetical protein BroJett018_25700 [Chloroflexota bacterium]|nr:MAG: hypothetical protein BroJett018_25700 [Chloroflexota bacterium]
MGQYFIFGDNMRWIPSEFPDKVKALYHSEMMAERQQKPARGRLVRVAWSWIDGKKMNRF